MAEGGVEDFQKKAPIDCTQGNKNHKLKHPKILLSPWPIYFFLTTVLVLVTILIFQLQIAALQHHLNEVKEILSNLNSTEGPRYQSRSQSKRSSMEFYDMEMSGIPSAFFKGAIHYQHIQKEGRIGPWSSTNANELVTLEEDNTEFEITKKGVYFLYAQIYYLTSQPHNTFQILSHNGTENRKRHRILATCSAQAWNSMGEVSCYTGLTRSLLPGERLYLNQIEQNRIIHFTDESSYFGLILLEQLK